MLSNKQLGKCKGLLLERQEELIKQLGDHFGLEEEFSKEVSGELSNYDNHPGDQGTELFERSKDTALNEHAERELEEINEALHAIAEGTYGICSKCGNDIPYERLLAVPATDRCIEHAAKDTFDRQRPIEEEVFSPNINPNEKTEEEETGYDAEDAWQEVSRYGSSDTPSDLYGDRDNFNEIYPNHEENNDGPEEIESYISSDEDGHYDEDTLNYYRNRK